MNCQLCNNPEAQTYDDNITLCASCAERASAYADRMNERLNRMRRQADRAEREGQSTLAQARQRAELIPFGQPILEGHHSERRDRNFREKIHNGFRRGYEALERAQSIRRSIQGAEGNRSVSSDDPLGAVKLREKLMALEDRQQHMKQVNDAIRRALKQPEEIRVEYLARALNFKLETAQRLLSEPDFMGNLGYAPYQLRNNNANIRSTKQRIAELEARQRMIAQADATSATEESAHGLTVERDLLDNRIRLHFPGKPSPEMIQRLKRFGFRWSPSNQAWQRHLNGSSEFAVSSILLYWNNLHKEG